MQSKRNITIVLDEETARWARVEAAHRETSLSRFVGDVLRQHMYDEHGYEQAMTDYLSRGPRPLRGEGEQYPSREELHDRAGLR